MKLLNWFWEYFPITLGFGAAIFCFLTGDQEHGEFFLLLALLGVIIHVQATNRQLLKKLLENKKDET